MTTPPVVLSFIDAVNRGDTSVVLGFFHPVTGVVVDAGRRFVGHKEIASWNEREFVGAGGRLIPSDIRTEGHVVTVVGRWESSFYTGPTRFVFRLDGERITELSMGQ